MRQLNVILEALIWNKKLINPEILSPNQYIMWGGIAGACNALISTPVEHIRIIMQNQSNVLDPRLRYTGSYDALKKIYRNHGFEKVYKGFLITMFRDAISFSIFFGSYEILKKELKKFNSDPHIVWLMWVGGVAGLLFWLPVFPLDVWKTRIQLDSFTAPKYKSLPDAFKKIYKHEGIGAFFNGLSPCIARAILASISTFGVYEITMKLISPDKQVN